MPRLSFIRFTSPPVERAINDRATNFVEETPEYRLWLYRDDIKTNSKWAIQASFAGKLKDKSLTNRVLVHL